MARPRLPRPAPLPSPRSVARAGLAILVVGSLAAGTPAHAAEILVEEAPAAVPAPVLPLATTALGAAETAALLARLPARPPVPPASPATAATAATSAVAGAPVPPPAAGSSAATLADEPPGPPDAGGSPGILLATPVERATVDAAPTVHFATPMVALGAPDDAAAVGASITPKIPGRWRWVGTRTLTFDPGGPLPAATAFAVEVPSGLRDAAGRPLPEGCRFGFTTPVPSAIDFSAATRRVDVDPVLVLRFDQAVSDRALASVRLEVNGREVPLRPATRAELEADESARRFAAGLPPAALLAFRPSAPLPRDARAKLTVAAGLPSAEGPLGSTAARTFSFRVRDAFRAVALRCRRDGADERSGSDPCPADAAWWLELTAPVDRVDPASFRVEPAVPEFSVHGGQGSRGLLVTGGFARGRYRVTVPGSLRSTTGETLGKDRVFELEVGPASPRLVIPRGGFLLEDGVAVLPPSAAVVPVLTRNVDRLRVTLRRVELEDFDRFLELASAGIRARHKGEEPPELPGGALAPFELAVAPRPDAYVETRIPLAAALPGRVGHVIVEVKAPGADLDRADSYEDRSETRPLWIQVTDLGVEARRDAASLGVWVTSLETARPLGGVEVAIGDGAPATTDAAGLARLPLPVGDDREARGSTGVAGATSPRCGGEPDCSRRLFVRSGPDRAFVLGYSGLSAEPRDDLLWYTLLDRDLYRPGETLQAKILLRRIERTATGDVTTTGLPSRLSWEVEFGGGEDLRGEAVADAPGAFTVTVPLPADARQGWAGLRVWLPGEEGGDIHGFRIAAYRRPEHTVAVAAGLSRAVAGDPIPLEAAARYHVGTALAGAEVAWSLELEPSNWQPPGRQDLWFGVADEADDESPPVRPRPRDEVTPHGVTGADGSHRLVARVRDLAAGRPVRLAAEATVKDGNGRSWTDEVELAVLPSAVAVGLATGERYGAAGRPIVAKALVVDLDGRAVAGRPLHVALERLERTAEERPRAVPAGSWTGKSAGEAVEVTFTPREGGEYRLVATTADGEGRTARTVLRRWVLADAPTPAPVPGAGGASLELVPDREVYEPGAVARVAVRAPFAPAEGLLTVWRGNVVRTERVSLATRETVLEVPVPAFPGLGLELVLLGPAADGVERRAEASVYLPVADRERRLSVTVRPREDALPPGGTTTLELTALDADGRPAEEATFTVVAVDEALLALTGYRHPDPGDLFALPWAQAHGALSLRGLLLAPPPDLSLVRPEASFGGGLGLSRGINLCAERPDEPSLRTRGRFDPVPLFRSTVAADREGRATVTLEVPDTLTRYRVVAIAADERRAGRGEAGVVVRQPLQVRATPPRFARPGDRFELPAVVENLGPRAVEAAVALEVRGGRIEGRAGRRVSLAPGARALVRFPVIAGDPGDLELRLAAAAGPAVDAVELALPVRAPATVSTLATYGTLEAPGRDAPAVAAVTVARPEGALRDVGGLEVSTGTGGIAALAGAARWLTEYPHGCAEQTSARLLGLLALRPYAARLGGALPAPADLDARLDAEVERLVALGRWNGFALWPGLEADGVTWASIQATDALLAVRASGRDPGEALSRALDHLAIEEDELGSSKRGAGGDPYLAAYGLWVRARGGGAAKEVRKGAALLAKRNGLPPEAAALLLAAIGPDPRARDEVARLLPRLEAAIHADAGTAHVLPGPGGHGPFGSQARSDALALLGLDAARPGHPLAEKLARGLLLARGPAGAWRTPGENAFAVLALAPRLAADGGTAGIVRAWLGARSLGERPVDEPLVVPAALLPEAPTPLVLQAGGPLPYRAALRWAPPDEAAPPVERGLSIVRHYEAVDDPRDVRTDPDGRVRIRAGARVRVVLEVATSIERRNVALVDPLPAGLEPVDAGLRGSKTDPGGGRRSVRDRTTRHDGPLRPDYEELGDDRAAAYADTLPVGRWTWSWLAVAPAPGDFVAPGATIEAMYEPEVAGRSRPARLRIEAR